MTVLGVLAGLANAVALAVGAQLQNGGVRRANERDHGRTDSGFSVRQFVALFRTPRWLGGSGLVTLAILLQLTALLLAPLPVVQPLGVLSLVVTALLDRRLSRVRLQRPAVAGIVVAVVGVAVFVTVAALTTRSSSDSVAMVVPVLLVLVGVLVVVAVGFVTARRRLPAVAFALAGGTCFGFVATLMKILLDRCRAAVEQHGTLFDSSAWFTLLVGVGAAVSGSVGTYLVQTAYSTGTPDLVVAALTVVDPIVAVALGVGLLGQARGAPGWAFAVAGPAAVVAAAGIVLLARHPAVPLEAAPDDGGQQREATA